MDFSRQAHVQILDHTCKNGQLLRLRTIVGFLSKLCSIWIICFIIPKKLRKKRAVNMNLCLVPSISVLNSVILCS